MAKSTNSNNSTAFQSLDRKHLRMLQNITVNNFDIRNVIEVFRNADRGNPVKQARISMEILEKDPDIAQATNTRSDAITGLEWGILPPKNIPENQKALAEEITNFVRDSLQGIKPHPSTGLVGMEGLFKNMQSALMPGYSVNQIWWKDTIGSGIEGFEFFQQDLFTFRDIEKDLQSNWPLLITRNNGTQKLVNLKDDPNQWVVHTNTPRSGDMVRGGLIRPSAYIYIMKHYNFKDWKRFLERHGMPFLAFEVDQALLIPNSDDENTEAQAANAEFLLDFEKMQDLAENLAGDGSAIFPKGLVEMEFHDSSKSNGVGFEKFQKICEQKIQQLILGQDSTSSSENANRSIGGVHLKVLHSIVAKDCKDISKSIDSQVIAPLVDLNFGGTNLIPRMNFDCKPDEDLKALADWVKALDEANIEVDDLTELEKKFGVKLKRKDIKEVA